MVYQTLFSGPNANKNATAGDKYAAKWRIDRHWLSLKACLKWSSGGLKAKFRPEKSVEARAEREKNAIEISFYYVSLSGLSELIAKERQILPLRSAYYS